MGVGTYGRGCLLHGRQAAERERQKESTVICAQGPAPSDLLIPAWDHLLKIP